METGTRLGPYEIVSRIGAGGMGEVWKARDTRLDRSVAVKILPAELAGSTQFRIRFEREAKTISQLQHPHICTLFDVGDDYLVMELLEGESLADRLSRGAMPVAEVLKFGAQIAEALDRAHRVGVVHRDLKPGNIMITRSGAKLLDFGLAKSSSAPAVEAEHLTIQKPLTQEGTVLGTFQYMAPEQLAGEEADARSDIFALGAVLYEMTTGKRAFDGKTKTSLVSQIVAGQPRAIREMQPMTPAALEHVIRKCLEKERDDRWQSAADVAEELRWAGETSAEMAAAPVRLRTAPWLIAVAGMAVLAAAAFGLLWRRAIPEKPKPFVTSINAPAETSYNFEPGSMALSPDGLHMAVLASGKDGIAYLHLQDFQKGEMRRLEGTGYAGAPFWSGDSTSIAFFADGKLKTVDIGGGPPQVIGDAPGGRGGTWSEAGTIVFAPRFRDGLFSMSATGSKPEQLTQLAKGEVSHRWPHFLPDGKHVLFLAQRAEGGATNDPSTIEVLSLATKERREVVRANSSVEYANGHLLFWRDGSLLAQPFDLDKLATRGNPHVIASGVSYSGLEQMTASVSRKTGTLVYHSGGKAAQSRIVWSTRTGMNDVLYDNFSLDHTNFFGPVLSPDGQRIAVAVVDQSEDVRVIDIARLTSTRVTYHGATENSPVWSPDGQWIAFRSGVRDFGDVYRKRASGEGEEEALVATPEATRPTSWSPDGKHLLLETFQTNDASFDIWIYSFAEKKARPLIQTPFSEAGAVFSPDGKWIAYSSNESGRQEVYVRSLSGDAKYQLSANGGSMPRWRSDGSEVFFIAPENSMTSVKISWQPQFTASAPQLLFTFRQKRRYQTDREVPTYDVTRDGQRFLVSMLTANSDAPITVVQHWADNIK
jgi:Tol biopolymer transport system component